MHEFAREVADYPLPLEKLIVKISPSVDLNTTGRGGPYSALGASFGRV